MQAFLGAGARAAQLMERVGFAVGDGRAAQRVVELIVEQRLPGSGQRPRLIGRAGEQGGQQRGALGVHERDFRAARGLLDVRPVDEHAEIADGNLLIPHGQAVRFLAREKAGRV